MEMGKVAAWRNILGICGIYCWLNRVHKEHAYDALILSMFMFSPFAFGLSLARTEPGLALSRRGRMRLALVIAIGVSGLFLILSWSTLDDLTNWQAFRQAFDNHFGVSVVGAFLILWIVFAVLFGAENSAETSVQNLCTREKVRYWASYLYLDVAVIAVFFCISFRQDSLFIPGSEYHWEYYVGVVQGIRNGDNVSDIAIGTGFSLTRDFDGELSDFKLSYDLF